MTQTCGKCLRVNPDEASYCYFDGALLGGHAPAAGPLGGHSRPFPQPFVFPSGRACHTFDQLALACQEEWTTAADLLLRGYLQKFLAGLGRADLAQAAAESVRSPDPDRALDQFLGRLPSEVLPRPLLRVEPRDVSLGLLAVGTRRAFPVTLENQGSRLLYGSVTCADGDWLALGDAPGASSKVFQFRDQLTIPVQVRGHRLRASSKALTARLVVESNGGSWTVTVRADVPPRPFPDGILKGALKPRQLAEIAVARPREAAPSFDSGAVARWYRDNGWVYPVQGPSASGLGGVQQFFEALGVCHAPRVALRETAVDLSGPAGAALSHSLEVRTEERRHVYAHATTDQPWLVVGQTVLRGRTAVLPLAIASIPDRPGQTLEARVFVRANGDQKFVVPVRLTIDDPLAFGADAGPSSGRAAADGAGAPSPGRRRGIRWPWGRFALVTFLGAAANMAPAVTADRRPRSAPLPHLASPRDPGGTAWPA